MSNRLRIGTRGSQLALWQANWIKEQLIRRHPDLDVEIVTIKTTGDKILDVPLAKVGGKGLFVKEIETALLEEAIDLAVHSMKDVPTEMPSPLGIVAVTKREDPRDAIIGRGGKRFADLPRGAKVGTSSLRRQAQLLASRPDFIVEPLRGNVNTRLRKLREGVYDAIVLARAGVIRLGWEKEVTDVLEPSQMLPAIGQGAVGVEARTADERTLGLIRFLDHPETSICVRAERAFLHRLEGGCQVPIAGHAMVSGGGLCMSGLVAAVDGSKIVRREGTGGRDAPERLGRELAERVLADGGRAILEEVYRRAIG